jgi:predicted secreted protein
MSTTTITGTIHGVNNAALAKKWISFRLVQLGTDSAATVTVAQSSDSVQTDSSGNFSIDIWDNGASGKQSVLEVTIDGSKAEYVIIPVGTVSIELWDLIENYQADGSTSEQVPVVSELFLRKSTNLSDLGSAATSRTNLGVAIGTDVQAHSAILDATTASFTSADETKLDGIEAGATITNATNILAAGGYVTGTTVVPIADGGTGATTAAAARAALGVPATSEGLAAVNNLSDLDNVVTARTNLGLGDSAILPSTAFATSAQGTTADNAIPTNAIGSSVQAFSTFLANTTASFTEDQRVKLLGIEPLADVTNATNITSAGGYVAGGADVALVDGGTGASDAPTARTNLGFNANATGSTTIVGVTSYTVLATDSVLTVNDTTIGGNVTINLPSAATVGSGWELIVKKTGSSHLVTLDASGTETIDEETTSVLEIENDSIRVVSDGTNWKIVGIYFQLPSPTTTLNTASYNVLASDSVIFVNNFGTSNVAITLPSALLVRDGLQLDIKKLGASAVDGLQDNVIVYANGTETIDNNASITITDQNQAIRLIADGSNWKILSPHNITGWAIYDDAASHATPITVNNNRYQVLIDNLGTSSNSNYLPSGVTEFWDTTNNKITPAKLGDAYDIRIDFEAQAAAGASSYANLILDVGDGVSIPIVNRNISFKGTGLSSFSVGFPVAAMDDFMLNGGKIYFDTSISGDSITLSNVVLFIKRDFSPL